MKKIQKYRPGTTAAGYPNLSSFFSLAGYSDSPHGDEKDTYVRRDCKAHYETGHCFAKITRWYFDEATGECEAFLYGGCMGNGNNYFTKHECEYYCRSERLY